MQDDNTRAAQVRRRELCFALALAAAGAGCATPAPSTRELRVYGNLSTLELGPVLLALHRFHAGKAMLAQGGITSLYGQAGDLPNMVARGTSDVATNSETQALRYSVEQPGLRCILTVAEGVYRILGRRSAGIGKLADLRGKRVGTMPKTSSAYYLDHTLRSVGMTEADVKIVPYVAGSARPLSMMTDALLKGEIDAMTIWEPEMQRAQDALGADLFEFHDPKGYREHFALFTTDAKLKDPGLRRDIVAFVASVIQASEAIRRDPREAVSLVARAGRYDEKLVARAWPHHTFPGTLLPNMLDVMVQEEVWVAKETGRAPRSRSALASLIDDSVVRDAVRSLARTS
jgi:sulfonate transport system substrate-binding protein